MSGFAGSGKSTLTEMLARHYGIGFVHASDLLRQLQTKKTVQLDTKSTVSGSGFWESAQGKKFLHQRKQDGSLDKELDKLLLKIAEKENIVMDSWTMPWLSKKGFKIWIKTDPKERAKRVALRDGLDQKAVLEKILERDKLTAEIYKKLYGFSLGPDKKVFDLIIDGTNLSKEEVFELAVAHISKKMKKLKN